MGREIESNRWRDRCVREYVEQLYGILWSVQRVDSAGGIWTFGGGGSSVDHLYVCARA